MSQDPETEQPPQPCDHDDSQPTATGTVDRSTSGSGVGSPILLFAVCALLLLAVIAVFGQTARHEFVNFDDDVYVYDNPMVTPGVTLKGVAWAFLHPRHVDYWRPISFLSHMLDYQFYGAWPGGHHLTNVLVHAAAAVLLFLVLRAMTGGTWPSALVAAVFAIHPLRVESVAWATERKDVLGALFFLLTLAAYVRYAGRPALTRYAAVAALFALGLMCKPTLVPLPLVLLLLDYWPLGRLGAGGAPAQRVGEQGAGISDFEFQISNLRFPLLPIPLSPVPPCSLLHALLEKLPLLALAAGSCFVTVVTGTKALEPVKEVPFSERTCNSLVSVWTYAGQLFWPAGLAPWYPNPQGGPAIWATALAVAATAAVSLAVIAHRRRQPWLLTGWFWYLAMLTPTVSMSQARMDRFTYLSQIGLCLALVWAVAEVSHAWPYRQSGLAGVASLLLAGLVAAAWQQTSYWCGSAELWTHALACTSSNWIAHNNLGLALAGRGHVDQAIDQYRKALKINPRDVKAHNNLALALAGRGQVDEAIAHYHKALEIDPGFIGADVNLGAVLAGRGQVEEAMAHYHKALELDPGFADAHINLGAALAGRGQIDEAIAHYHKALEIKPDSAEAHNNLALALFRRKQIDEAIAHYRKALKIEPDYLEAHFNLGLAMATSGHGDEALAHYQKALDLATARNERALADAIRARIARVPAQRSQKSVP